MTKVDRPANVLPNYTEISSIIQIMYYMQVSSLFIVLDLLANSFLLLLLYQFFIYKTYDRLHYITSAMLSWSSLL